MEARKDFCAGMHEARQPHLPEPYLPEHYLPEHYLPELTSISSLLNIVSQVVFAQYSLGLVAFLTINDGYRGEFDPGR